MSRKQVASYPVELGDNHVQGDAVHVLVRDNALHLTIKGVPFHHTRRGDMPDLQTGKWTDETREGPLIIPAGGAIEIEYGVDGVMTIFTR